MSTERNPSSVLLAFAVLMAFAVMFFARLYGWRPLPVSLICVIVLFALWIGYAVGKWRANVAWQDMTEEIGRSFKRYDTEERKRKQADLERVARGGIKMLARSDSPGPPEQPRTFENGSF